jgi:hypothetical protein
MGARGAAAVALAVVLAGCQSEGRLVRVVPSPEDILGQATTVARVRVLSSDPIEVPFKQGAVSCGSYYRVEVVDAVKGDAGATLDFVTDRALDVGGEYLVAVRDTEGRRDLPADWSTEQLRCRANYPRFATGSAPVVPGADGMDVVVRGARMVPERIREQADGGRVPWTTVKRELFVATPEPELPPLEATEPTPAPPVVEPEPAAPPEIAEPAAPEPVAPEPQAEQPARKEKNRWLPWNWDFEWL